MSEARSGAVDPTSPSPNLTYRVSTMEAIGTIFIVFGNFKSEA